MMSARVILLATLLVATAACTVDAGSGSGTAADGRGAAASTSATEVPTSVPPPSPAEQAQRVGGVPPEEPVSVSLPDGSRVPVRAVSTTANGVLDVPEDIRTAGWWQGGSRIGDPFGSTLVAAHVDSGTQGLGPFASLLGARPGQRVVVRTAGLEQTFRIESLRLRPRGSISARSALHSPAGERRLTLVTCASPFVPAKGGYQNLAVVVAVPVAAAVSRVRG